MPSSSTPEEQPLFVQANNIFPITRCASVFDDETTGSCQNISTAEYDIKMEGVREGRLSVSVADWTVIFIREVTLVV
jgi:hypothetical protein